MGDREDFKLQKILADKGLGSRRECEALIEQGLVRVNGETAKLGDRASLYDRIQYKNREVTAKNPRPTKRRVIIYNKPVGEVCTRRDEKGRTTVFRQLPRLKGGRWIAVGRLDINTSGLLLFTNDGELANRLMHPQYEIDREYAIRVNGRNIPDATLEQLRSGVELDDGPANFSDLQYYRGEGANHWYHGVLMEGRNREVRRLWQAVGYEVSRLKRVRFGPIFLDSSVKVGQTRECKPEEIKALIRRVGI